MLVEALTNNRNRMGATSSAPHGASLGEPASVAWDFDLSCSCDAEGHHEDDLTSPSRLAPTESTLPA